ncbi:unnamed protein product [Clonostachys byssicola]|uniref:Uncharacterized protein n=1 Tax=Clonostachys byssicola TaxID=160290 RepID=A0A9N9UMK4_9HYPO|nr:unnamed protein product [Clonostachys byssicola]
MYFPHLAFRDFHPCHTRSYVPELRALPAVRRYGAAGRLYIWEGGWTSALYLVTLAVRSGTSETPLCMHNSRLLTPLELASVPFPGTVPPLLHQGAPDWD